MATTRFEQALMQHLTPGASERFELTPAGLEIMAEVTEAAIRSPTARAEIRRALQLIIALRSTLNSPRAADGLSVVVANAPGIRAHLEALSGDGPTRDAALQFLEQQGRAPPKSAPPMASPRERKGLQVKDLLSTSGRPGLAGSAGAARTTPPTPKLRRGQFNTGDEE